MSNQSYMGVWCKDFPQERILERLEAFLSVVPFSKARPGFTYLAIRALDASESPLLEQDLRAMPLDPAEIVEMAKAYSHDDCSCQIGCNWDLWILDVQTLQWKVEPQPLEIFCHGEAYDNSFWRENGHFEVHFGFEHFFTGHAGLLGIRRNPKSAQSPEEARFIEAMAWPENLQRYQNKTQENIRKLFDWVHRIETTLPVEQIRLWSEGEDNFEARLEEILAAR